MTEFIETDTEFGRIRGVKQISALNVAYNSFLGLRYATPPIENLRFKNPLPLSKWEGVYDATQEKSGCYEMNSVLQKIIGSEDCLFLNIFSKDVSPSKLQPVMVYIHGGAFHAGSNSTKAYGPDYLLLADVVVVTINYRLGAFGFLCLKDKSLDVPGNAGLKDQRMALKFVKKNIKSFGGDPNNITLFGQSAGGSSVSWHCVSEQSKGLFNRAIIMSGCVLNQWSLTPQLQWPERLARKLGYQGNDEEKNVLDFLQKANPVKIVEVQRTLIKEEEKVAFSFAPHIEHYETEDAVISSDPLELLRNAWSNDIDILLGGTSDEGIMYQSDIKENPAMLKHFKLESVVPIYDLDIKSPEVIRFVDSLRQIYYSPSSDISTDELGYCRIKTDQHFWHGLQRLAQGRQNSGGSGKTFLYRFALDSPTQNHYRIRRLGAGIRGVCHADDVCYLFKNIFGGVPARESVEFKTIMRFVSLFTSFATTGNPNDNVIDADMQDIKISPIDSLEPPFKCFNIDETLSFDFLPESKRLEIWDRLYKETNTLLF